MSTHDQFGVSAGMHRLKARTAATVPLLSIADARGALSAGEFGVHVPFVSERYFVISGVEPGATRGNHAHRTLHEFIVCLHGSCTVTVDDGSSKDSVTLSSQATGLYAAPLTWILLTDFSPSAVVLVLASAVYDAGDYIRDYDEFLRRAALTHSAR